MNNTRAQVKAEIIRTIAAAQVADGSSGVDAARHAFPGIPESVLWECWAEVDDVQAEAWWQSIERTIDGEVIRNAVAVAGAR